MSELYRRMQPFLGDEAELIRRMAGRIDLWEECVALFPGAEIIAETDNALQREDDTALYALVHRLKGNLSNFGFDCATQAAMEVLRAIKEKDRNRIKQYYTELREQYLQIAERLGEAK